MLCRSVGKLIIDVGLLVAEQCDRYLQQQNPAWPPGTLQRSIADTFTQQDAAGKLTVTGTDPALCRFGEHGMHDT